ncbi:sensor protein ZraS [bacterium BMS3Bbin06]|nr:sensor protein ZraS [bacterium BMS3Abin08]GBE35004.1 sensor protein ZraS [bacterium BMS3Bbin06]HDY71122.1 sensor histidine kinase [Nitrospirota bacterium]
MLRSSLKWKYILSTLLILVVIISIFSCYNLRYQEDLITEDDEKRVELITDIIKNGLYTIMLEGRGREFQKFLESLIAEDIKEVRIFNPSDGKILASSIPTEIGKQIYKEDMSRFTTQRSPEVFIHSREHETVYSMIMPIMNDKPCQRCHGSSEKIRGVLDVEISMHKTASRIKELRHRTILFSILTFVSLSFALAILTTLLVNKPVEGIIRTMKKVEGGDLSVRFKTKRKDEIGRLAKTLNSMLTELDRARQEIQRCHIDEMKRVERMATLGEMAAAIAHEIKNPLAGISGAIQVISEDFKGDDPRKEIVGEILNEIERLDKAVRNLLSFAKPINPKKEVVNLKNLLEKTVNLISPQAERQNVKIKFQNNLTTETGTIDPEQIQQVILNIILNALHSMPGGGTLTVAVKDAPGAVEIDISDTGEGIPQEELKKIFKPFFTTRHTGTGLGLAISWNIVEAHGGRIDVSSTPGIGSSFTIYLPV